MTNVQRHSLNRFLFDGGPKDIYSISPDVEISQMKKKNQPKTAKIIIRSYLHRRFACPCLILHQARNESLGADKRYLAGRLLALFSLTSGHPLPRVTLAPSPFCACAAMWGGYGYSTRTLTRNIRTPAAWHARWTSFFITLHYNSLHFISNLQHGPRAARGKK